MLSRVALSFSLVSASVCSQQVSQAADALLQRAGDARPAYERAWHKVEGAERQGYEFLLAHMPKKDFADVPPALLLENVRLAQTVRSSMPWGASLSDEMFFNYVVPYAQANETRESWRPEMVAKFLPLVTGCKTPGEAARKLNETIFNQVNVHYSTKRRRADQSPSESIEQGKASCTGLSILLADACRACCVPARLISVRWPHKRGNHTWVEVWDGNAWRFVGADEPDPKGFDRAWFVGDAKKCAGADRAHRVWAVSFQDTGERFRAGWGAQLWGVDVTSRYAGASQKSADDAVRVQIDRYFASDEKAKAAFSFDMNLDAELKTKKGDARLRKLVWQSLQAHAAKQDKPGKSKKVHAVPEGGWPRSLVWTLADDGRKDHYWLHVAEPQAKQGLSARLLGNSLEFESGGNATLAAWLDARYVDLSKPVEIKRKSSKQSSQVVPRPSLRTLCRTMQERGDPNLAATWVVPLRSK